MGYMSCVYLLYMSFSPSFLMYLLPPIGVIFAKLPACQGSPIAFILPPFLLLNMDLLNCMKEYFCTPLCFSVSSCTIFLRLSPTLQLSYFPPCLFPHLYFYSLVTLHSALSLPHRTSFKHSSLSGPSLLHQVPLFPPTSSIPPASFFSPSSHFSASLQRSS